MFGFEALHLQQPLEWSQPVSTGHHLPFQEMPGFSIFPDTAWQFYSLSSHEHQRSRAKTSVNFRSAPVSRCDFPRQNWIPGGEPC